jgi:hypothetical protein
MKLPWNRDELGRELRAARPKPPAGLESAIEQDIETERRRSRGLAPRFRFGLAATATAVMVASFTVAGGMAAASSSVQHALNHVAQAVHLSSPSPKAAAPAASPAGDQYGRKKNCGKSARGRENASLHAATRQLNHDLALAGKDYKQRVANARKLSAEKRNAAMHRAYSRYVAARHAAYNRHAAAVKKAVGRYKADVKKCATA